MLTRRKVALVARAPLVLNTCTPASGPTYEDAADAIQIKLQPTLAVTSPLYAAIALRQCTRSEFDGQALSTDDLRLLQAAVKCPDASSSMSPSVQLLLITKKPKMEQVLAQVIAAKPARTNAARELLYGSFVVPHSNAAQPRNSMAGRR